MTDTGLTTRLRQHSRRAGLAVALVMALTIAICIGGFAVIYAQLQPFIRDFVSQEAPVEDGQAFTVGRRDDEATREAANDENASDVETTAAEARTVEAEDEPEPEPTEPPAPTPTSDAFAPDLQSNSNSTINLRSEPSTAGGESTVITTLTPASPIRATGERVPADNPAQDGDFWIEVETADRETGWIREIDTEPYDPDA